MSDEFRRAAAKHGIAEAREALRKRREAAELLRKRPRGVSGVDVPEDDETEKEAL